jgi:epoxyqueuosine reductase
VHDRDGPAGPAVLREAIRTAALETGFSACGFAPADRPAHAEAYLEWLERGRHAEMAYMAREDAVRRRLDPREALEGCRSIVVCLLSYAPPEARTPAGRDSGESGPRRVDSGTRAFDLPPDRVPTDDPSAALVARYALGRDYHDVFEERLDALAGRIRQLAPRAVLKRYVDYGPVMERDHAQRAGLGWIGKNTMLIDPDRGSWLLIGELLTTLELPPDPSFLPDRCGTCTRCLEACPTDAIVAAREVDARRCISYLTIELRGPFPLELRPLIGNRVFGCDICQEVCPWNREPAPGAPEALALGRPVAPEAMRAWTEELLERDDEAFRERYGETALSRPGRVGLLRNLCVGLGNHGASEDVPLLERCLEEPSPLVRAHAAWALGRIGTVEAKALLSARASVEADEAVGSELAMALAP